MASTPEEPRRPHRLDPIPTLLPLPDFLKELLLAPYGSYHPADLVRAECALSRAVAQEIDRGVAGSETRFDLDTDLN